MPLSASTTSKLPRESKAIDLGFARPVATTATSYPETTDGFMDLVGLRDVEQEDAAAAPETQSIQRLRNETMVEY